MKTIIFIAFACIMIIQSFAQNRIDPPKVIDKTSDTVFINNSNEFIKGWNMGENGKRLDDAIRVNYYDRVTNSLNQRKYILL